MLNKNETLEGSPWNWWWPAPAKLNLMLRITGRRNDGYHLLQTVFQIIDLCDWLKFHENDSDQITLLQDIADVATEDNLVVRAAKLLKKEAGYNGGVTIEIEKKLPMGGGLGGGSSDAATTLVALNKLWQLGFSERQLIELGVSLGADVPVFIHGYTAWAEGVGEHLQKIDVPQKYFLVIRPDIHVSTKDVFLSEALTRDSKSITIADFLAGQQQNDCQDVVKKQYPIVDKALKVIGVYGDAKLTGTGSCVFVQFDDEQSGKSAFEDIRTDWEAYFVKGLQVSPLIQMLRSN